MILEIEYNHNPCFVDKETEAWNNLPRVNKFTRVRN